MDSQVSFAVFASPIQSVESTNSTDYDGSFDFADAVLSDQQHMRKYHQIDDTTPTINFSYDGDVDIDIEIEYDKDKKFDEYDDQFRERVMNFVAYIKSYLEGDFDSYDMREYITKSDIDLEKYCYYHFDLMSTDEFYEIFCEIIEHCYHPKKYSIVFGKVLGYMIKFILNKINIGIGYYTNGDGDIVDVEDFEESLSTFKSAIIDMIDTKVISVEGENYSFTWKYGVLYSILEPIKKRMTEFIYSHIDSQYVNQIKIILSKYDDSDHDAIGFTKLDMNGLREDCFKMFHSLYLI